MKIKRGTIEIMLPVIIVALFGVLLVTGTIKGFEYKVKDAFTWLVPEAPVDPKVVIIDIDDQAIQNVGMWPWSRDVHADILMQLKELGASYLTYDIEFVDRGPVGVTSRERDQTIKAKGSELGEVFGALQQGQLKMGEAKDYAETILNEGIMMTARDNDELLGRAVKVFGKAFATLNYDLDEGNKDDPNSDAQKAIQFVKEKSWLPDVSGDINGGSVFAVPKLRGAIVSVAANAAAAGITNVSDYKDADGVLRRITLLNRLVVDDKGTVRIFGQLAFMPIWDKLGRPAIEVHSDSIVLKTSALASNSRPDIRIPLDPNGKMIINWPHRKSSDPKGFNHVYVSWMQNLKLNEQAIYDFVYASLRPAGYLSNNDFTTLYDEAQLAYKDTLTQGDPALFDQYMKKHDAWIAAFTDFAGGDAEKSILASLEQTLADPKISAKDKKQIEDVKATVGPSFDQLRKLVAVYTEGRTELKKRLADAFCFIGVTAAATTDFGLTPFDVTYPMVGTHAAIANTVFNGAFQYELPMWISFVIGALLSLSMILVARRFKTFMAAIVGFAVFVGLMVVVALIFVSTGVYIGALLPGLTLFTTVVAMTLLRFFGSEKDKAFLKTAFSSYISPEAVKDIIANPDKLKLGGEKRMMTAMFTDVRGFSTFSEKLDPQDLVALLNRYLTQMSDIVLETRGTIDKYEGDAIIAFWNAPATVADHAVQAARSAVLMKRAEALLNPRLIADGMVTTPLLTRIGINTGDMTVGNMGTPKSMNYTIMGNAVNLAARLEGVNKQYETWILTSESTRNQLGDQFLVRRLDRVRVVGISTPVRLYEIADILADAPPLLVEVIAKFETGLDLFETKDWDGAAKVFEEILILRADDGPSKKYLKRCKDFKKEPPAETWDGVFSLTEK